MKRVGAHVSIAGGVENAPVNAAAIGARAFGLFTKNQRQWSAKPLSRDNISKFEENCQRLHFEPRHILPHSSYLINLGHPQQEQQKKSFDAFLDELVRCEQLGLTLFNFHPGAHLQQSSVDECLKKIADSVNRALAKTHGVVPVIENTAGMGSTVGSSFEQLAFIIHHVDDKSRVGICLDTCHLYAAGYDLVDGESFQKTIEQFDRIVGLKHLKALHLNDSKKSCASHVDRHAAIGEGVMGLDPFRLIMNDSRFEEIPLILETPDESRYAHEIELLYGLTR
jgi:deoxyribonuclease IV